MKRVGMGSKRPVLDLDLIIEEPDSLRSDWMGINPPDLQTLLSDQESVHESSAGLWVQRLLCTSEQA